MGGEEDHPHELGYFFFDGFGLFLFLLLPTRGSWAHSKGWSGSLEEGEAPGEPVELRAASKERAREWLGWKRKKRERQANS